MMNLIPTDFCRQPLPGYLPEGSVAFGTPRGALILTLLFISHDLLVVKALCSRVLVMEKGKIVEEGETASLFSAPRHPYTQKLLNAILRLDN